MANQLSPAQRAINFATLTRQHELSLPTQSLVENATTSFDIPKVRYLSRVVLDIVGTYKAIHANSTNIVPARYAPYEILKQVKIDLNNGFSPFKVDGASLAMYNAKNELFPATVLLPAQVTTTRVPNAFSLTTAPTPGANASFRFSLDLTAVINERDPIGLINAQNQEQTITVSLDVGTVLSGIMNDAAGYSTSSVAITCTPYVQTYTIPQNDDAKVDDSVLKSVLTQVEALALVGDNIIKLPRGMTYRSIIVDLRDANNVGIADSDINLVELILNQADTPYRWTGRALSAKNAKDLGVTIPVGTYFILFDYQGIPGGLGGARDAIDTAELSEFWLKINTNVVCTARLVLEQLSILPNVGK